jgi:hypothetical protein
LVEYNKLNYNNVEHINNIGRIELINPIQKREYHTTSSALNNNSLENKFSIDKFKYYLKLLLKLDV